jgi:site-specific DNA-methyltransferase (adenine-specific)
MIYCGDCLDIMPTLPDKSIDMILCDLPYGTTACKWDVVIPFEPLWKEYKRLIKDNGAIVLTASQPFTTALVASNLKMFKYCWYWEKSQAVGHLNAYKMPMKNVEEVCVFYKKRCPYNPQLTMKPTENIRPETKIRKQTQCYGGHSKESIRRIPLNQTLPKQTIRFNNCQDNLHPTQKPVALFEYLIRTYTNEGEMVLDNCAGSGTTGVACTKTRRKYILIEKDPKYIATIEKRIRATQPPLALELT